MHLAAFNHRSAKLSYPLSWADPTAKNAVTFSSKISMNSLPPPTVMVEKTDAVDYHTHDAEPGSDTDDDYDCFVPLEAAEDREDAEMGAQVNASAHLPEEHN